MEKELSLVDQAYKQIVDRICDLELYPGQIISDFTLTKEMGMSRTPIRQALQKVERDGLIASATAGTSYEVSKITEEDIIELFDARECIEAMAVKLAVEKGVPEPRLVELERINRRMDEEKKEGKIRDNFTSDQEFHDYLVCLSGNRRLMRFHESLLIQMRRIRMLSYLERTYQDKAFRDHQDIIDKIKGGDKMAAVHALEEHVETSKRDYLYLLNDKLANEGMGVLRFFGAR